MKESSATRKVSRKARPSRLAQKRERNGVSLGEIAERTRIPLRHLEELERGDVSQWPAGVYAKSWARDYAHEAGLDPDEVTAFVAPVADVDISTEDIKKARNLRERLSARRRSRVAGASRKSALLGRIATVVIVLTLLAIAAVFVWKKTEPVPAASRTVEQPVGTSGVTPATPPR